MNGNSKISIDDAVFYLREALRYEFPSTSDLTDQCVETIIRRLRRDPRFAGLTLSDTDLLFADARREFEDDLNTIFGRVERRLIQNFKDEISAAEREDQLADEREGN